MLLQSNCDKCDRAPQPETEAYGISSFVYRARRPFHPQRLSSFFGAEWPGVLRSKGIFWLATRVNDVGGWSQAGPMCRTSRLGFFWAGVPRSEWEGRGDVLALWEEPYGDRRQELVMIGMDMNEPELRAGFDACLLRDEEMALGPDGWARLPDPFPDWS
jgi:G3E family GTPase